MREIKFRAWNGQSMIMPRTNAYYQHYLSFCGNITQKNSEGMECFGGGDRWSRVEKLELMQFTGLQDKNGVDIYEGDVIQFSDKYEWYRSPCQSQKQIKEILEDHVKYPYERRCVNIPEDYEWLLSSEIQNIWEVIGNIHQNPELLESVK
jgi:uncharacterized phage protein (TIGR01671 family)